MDHSHMDHSAMGHDLSSADMNMPRNPNACAMSMLFTWNTKNLCIVFRWWHVRGTPSLIISLLGVVALTALFELLRSSTRRYELYVERTQEDLPQGSEAPSTERTPLVWSGREQVEVSKRAHVVKAFLYALQTFYAFMLMLLFMTYNGWVMAAVGVGAFVGYLAFGNHTSATKDSACH